MIVIVLSNVGTKNMILYLIDSIERILNRREEIGLLRNDIKEKII